MKKNTLKRRLKKAKKQRDYYASIVLNGAITIERLKRQLEKVTK